MQLTALVAVAATLTTTALGAVLPNVQNFPPVGYQWTIRNFKRSCNSGDTSCAYTFSVDKHSGNWISCAYTVTGSPASHTEVPAGSGINCGGLAITSAWNAGGWTTWSVVDNAAGLITFPAYSDSDLKNGVTVSPDRSFDVYSLS